MASKRAKRRACERKEREWRERSCGDKIKFTSRGRALVAAGEVARRKGDYLVPYQCQFCSTSDSIVWHIGHPKVFGRNGLN